MKKLIKILPVLILFSLNIYAQNELRGSMGIALVSSNSLRDYINHNYATSSQQLSAFNTAVTFEAEYGCQLKEDFQIGMEYQLLMNSFNLEYFLGNYDISYNIHAVSVMGYYVLPGKGYRFKLGGGMGPRFVRLSEKISSYEDNGTYNSTGFGIVAKAEGETTLGGNLYAYIGGDLRYDINGKPEKNGKALVNIYTGEKVNLNSFFAELKLGITYLF